MTMPYPKSGNVLTRSHSSNNNPGTKVTGKGYYDSPSPSLSDGVIIDDISPATSNGTPKTSNASPLSTSTPPYTPLKGSLRRIRCETSSSSYSSSPYIYMVDIPLPSHKKMALRFERLHYEHIGRLFSIIDADNLGLISREDVSAFVALRCPVFRRRDETLRQAREATDLSSTQASTPSPSRRRIDSSSTLSPSSSTFDEVWNAVVSYPPPPSNTPVSLGIEAFLVFCRLIALAQYQEAKQRFQKHTIKTLRHRSGDEMLLVNAVPPSAPSAISLLALREHEGGSEGDRSLPLPELDLNHCLVAAHDDVGGGEGGKSSHCKISVFGGDHAGQYHPPHSSAAEFTIEFWSEGRERMMRRTLSDLAWLRDTFASHQALGGTLCGRILPPFPKKEEKSLTSAGFGVLNSLTKSFWGRGKKVTMGSGGGKKKEEEKARQLERCLNYLLEHPALKTSFPLNAVLKASQSGLDAAKRILEDEMAPPTQALPPMDETMKTDFSQIFSSPTATNPNPNFYWIRTAAQAAMALKLHGILDATGYASASARLQHASLPSFSLRRGETNSPPPSLESSCMSDRPEEVCFESGVRGVESELDDDEFDLLPSTEDESTKFHYGISTLNQSSATAWGSVDDDIDKLREIIGAMDNTLGRCLAASTSIGEAMKKKNALHLDIVRGLDSWGKGEIIAERSLLKGVGDLETKKDLLERCDYDLNDALAWQSSLASSAVSAAEDVRSAVRAFRTASGAKAAAESAALAAQKAAQSTYHSPEDARAAQTRASISHSHAIHAAVIEHEAFAAKRKAAMALAHDVKCWNKHRKREMLNICLEAAKRQREVTRMAVGAWAGLWEGLIPPEDGEEDREREAVESLRSFSAEEDYAAQTSIDPDVNDESSESPVGCPKIVPVDHRALNLEHLKTTLPLIPNILEGDNNTTPLTSRSFHTPRRIQEETNRLTKSETEDGNDVMTASMQSLVDGLMTWGGRYDPQDDLSLPSGMAMSIALEESGVLNRGDGISSP